MIDRRIRLLSHFSECHPGNNLWKEVPVRAWELSDACECENNNCLYFGKDKVWESESWKASAFAPHVQRCAAALRTVYCTASVTFIIDLHYKKKLASLLYINWCTNENKYARFYLQSRTIVILECLTHNCSAYPTKFILRQSKNDIYPALKIKLGILFSLVCMAIMCGR